MSNIKYTPSMTVYYYPDAIASVVTANKMISKNKGFKQRQYRHLRIILWVSKIHYTPSMAVYNYPDAIASDVIANKTICKKEGFKQRGKIKIFP